MKSLFALTETSEQQKKIVFALEDTIQELSDDENPKQKIETFLQNLYFGTVNQANFHGFPANFFISFFQPDRGSFNEMHIEDNIYLVQSGPLQDLKRFTIIMIISKDQYTMIPLFQHCLKFIFMCLMQLQEEGQYLQKILLQNLSLQEQFTKSVLELKDNFKERIQQISKELSAKCELREKLLLFNNQVRKRSDTLEMMNFRVKLPVEIPIKTQITIRPYQTMLLAKYIIEQQKVTSPRFQTFITSINPTRSFKYLCLKYNFNLQELQTYVNYIVTNDASKSCHILNELILTSYFTLHNNNTAQFGKHETKFYQLFQKDMYEFVQVFDKPCSMEQIRLMNQNPDKPKLHQQIIIGLLGQRIIRECQVYLYSIDPLYEPSINQKQPSFLQIIQPFLNQPIIIQEIAQKIKIQTPDILKQVKKYHDQIGIYFI